jgi:glutathione synthase/RimK-type ligase-like ATP-grasp enzyme
MAKHIVVIDQPKDFKWPDPAIEVMTPRDFITRPSLSGGKVRVINLCRDTSYLSLGYYCSLLAEARRQKVIPAVEVLLELNWKRLYRTYLPELEAEFSKALQDETDLDDRTVYFFFGRNPDERLTEIGRRLFDLFRSPILAVELRYKRDWRIRSLGTESLREVPAELGDAFADALIRYTKAAWRSPRQKAPSKYDLAVLYDPEEAMPPSDPKALEKFAEAGRALGIAVTLVTRRDLGKLAEFDALFIRETTRIDNHTYRFAKKAAAEGMPVIDDPGSILRCTNKVYLAELLQAHKVPAPRTLLVDSNTLGQLDQTMPYPIVLKIPDGSFSRGVHKAENRDELEAIAKDLLKRSDVILAQEFMYTEYDWRVGILNRKPLYVSQYMMARKHWQIVQHGPAGRVVEGDSKTLAVADAPAAVVETALTAANLIGDGLYGVDLKQNERGVFVIEINDNPSIDAGIEDAVLKDALYTTIIQDFTRRIEGRAGGA